MKRLLSEASPQELFILGLLTLPAFLFQEKMHYRLLACLFFLLLAFFSGKKIRPMPALLLLASVTGAALLVPHGKVIANIWGFPVTLGAMKMGFSRGVLLLGLFYLSKFTVVRGLELPGKTGQGIARVFFYFERFADNYSTVSVRDLPGSLDRLLLKVSENRNEESAVDRQHQDKRMVLVLPLLVSLVCWSFLFF